MFKKAKDKLKNNKVLMISLIALLIILIGGVSYAAFNYNFVGEDNVLSTGDVSIKFLESNTNVISLKNALPEADDVGKKENSFDFAVTSKASYDTSLKYTLSIEKLSVDTGYTSLSDNQIKVYLTDYSNKELISPTLISNLSNKVLYNKTNKHSSTNTSITDKYKIRVWVDKDVNATSWTKDSKFSYKFKIGLKSSEVDETSTLDQSEANAPVLDSGMIPVYYDATSETWKKADENNMNESYKWYDYDNKMWANSVTVSSTNRSTYQSAEAGTTIPMDDILTMQVWIPRYKYKVWNYNANGTKTSEPQQIEITFEKGTAKTGEITCQDAISGTEGDPSEVCKLKSTGSACTDNTCNNKTYTHPAFTFGNEEIKGFWIGKFEVSATDSLEKTTISSVKENKDDGIIVDKIANSDFDMKDEIINDNVSKDDVIVKKIIPELDTYSCTTLYDGKKLESCSDLYFPITKPNIHSWTDGKIKLYEDSMMNMKNSGNSYGLNVSTDVHMIKNSEWGAVAYLSHSKYGTCENDTCTEIGINNNSNYTTGCVAEVGSSYSSICNGYNTILGQKASTTLNIYGVYDMSGGAREYAMGNVVNSEETTMIPNYSGYTTITYPDVKYYDKYSYSTSDITRKRSKLGDGIREVYNTEDYGWYNDKSYFAISSYPWLTRGGDYNSHVNAGVFTSEQGYGGSLTYYSSRLVITP